MPNTLNKRARLGAPSQPGKLAPLLYADVYGYDILARYFPGHNPISDKTPKYEAGHLIIPTIPEGACRHNYFIKENRICAPPSKSTRRLDKGIYSNLLAICPSCRTHLEIEMDLRRVKFEACPTKTELLHHFLYLPEESTSRKLRKDCRPGTEELHKFECSSPRCGGILTVHIRSPIVKKEWVRLLTDRDVLRSRYLDACESYPDRVSSIEVRSAKSVLTNLATYIKSGLSGGARKRISARSMKWLTSFGPFEGSCEGLLRSMGFSYNGDSVLLPNPQSPADKEFLEDVVLELSILICDFTQNGSSPEHDCELGPPIALTMQKMMGFYGAILSSSLDDEEAEGEEGGSQYSLYLRGLGAMAVFNEDLILYAYERQTATDPDQAPYYLECLQGIAKVRETERLTFEVAMEQSKGIHSRIEIRRAYDYFGIDDNGTFDDETIIGVFHSRVSDASSHENECRENLKIIAADRKSRKILNEAEMKVDNHNDMTFHPEMSYEVALNWLEATEETDDEFLSSLYLSKVADNPNQKDVAQKALEIIAKHRGSEPLFNYLRTGQLHNFGMDIGLAYSRLGIHDPNVDDDMIYSAFQVGVLDDPSRRSDLEDAFTSIAHSRKSSTLISCLQNRDSFHSLEPSLPELPRRSQWPVGLRNIGNTCYLNSLLQFFFSVKPLRELVLNFERYKMESTPETLERKQVGSRKITLEEVEKGYRFATELGKLFQSMIETPYRTIAPEKSLAVAIAPAVNNTKLDETMSNLPLGTVDGLPVLGPTGPPPSYEVTLHINGSQSVLENHGRSREKADSAQTPPESPQKAVQPPKTDASSDTLVSPEGDDTLAMDISEDVDEKCDNDQTKRENDKSPSTPVRNCSPLPQRDSLIASFRVVKKKSGASADKTAETVKVTPPPVPPRPKPSKESTAEENVPKEVEAAFQQQDVTEAIGNALFRLECAIRPVAFTDGGEQLDEIKDILYGKMEHHLVEQGNDRSREEFFSDIKVIARDVNQDIYSALDCYFDQQTIDLSSGTAALQYSCISQIPPLLGIFIHRAQYSAERGAYKSMGHIELRETIYMDRYMKTNDSDLVQRRTDFWKWKRELKSLEERLNGLIQSGAQVDISDALGAVKNYSLDIQEMDEEEIGDYVPVDATTVQYLDEACVNTRREREQLEMQIKDLQQKIRSQFTDLRTAPYRIQAVFMHHGAVNFGHYIVYIYDFESEVWRKYNDEKVEEVTDPQREIFGNDTMGGWTPNFVVYVREGQESEMVESVKREIREVTGDAMEDVREEDKSKDIDMNDAIEANGVDERANGPRRRSKDDDDENDE